jgi:hypothetical protein
VALQKLYYLGEVKLSAGFGLVSNGDQRLRDHNPMLRQLRRSLIVSVARSYDFPSEHISVQIGVEKPNDVLASTFSLGFFLQIYNLS